MIHAVILRRKAEDDIRTVLRWYDTQDPTYVAESSRIVVLAVLHTSRDPTVWPKK